VVWQSVVKRWSRSTSYSTVGPVSTVMGDSLQTDNPSGRVISHRGRLSLLGFYPPWDSQMNINFQWCKQDPFSKTADTKTKIKTWATKTKTLGQLSTSELSTVMNDDGGCGWLAAYRRTCGSNRLAWSRGRRPLVCCSAFITSWTDEFAIMTVLHCVSKNRTPGIFSNTSNKSWPISINFGTEIRQWIFVLKV